MKFEEERGAISKRGERKGGPEGTFELYLFQKNCESRGSRK